VAKPQIAVISVGAENTFGHPNENTLTRLKEFVSSNNILRTDNSGSIEFTTDGQDLWVKTEK
jgi:competence protein ComEC